MLKKLPSALIYEIKLLGRFYLLRKDLIANLATEKITKRRLVNKNAITYTLVDGVVPLKTPNVFTDDIAKQNIKIRVAIAARPSN